MPRSVAEAAERLATELDYVYFELQVMHWERTGLRLSPSDRSPTGLRFTAAGRQLQLMRGALCDTARALVQVDHMWGPQMLVLYARLTAPPMQPPWFR